MLKWAVNQPRPSYLDKASDAASTSTSPTPSCSPCRSPTATPLLMQRVKAKRHCPLGLGKENIELTSTSTPLPAASTRTPLLRDLSNIINMSPLQTTTTTTTTTTPQVQRCRSQLQLKPTTVYASTLPTFEAEYSPSYRTNQENQSNNIIPGPLLALRGIGIPDSYFEKPRYLEQKSIPQPLPSVSTEAGDAPSVEPTLSSTQMGDVTLERMIDAILESTRKPPTGLGAAAGRPRCRQRLRHRHQHQHQQRLLATGVVHSPTYRPAFDPASDLREYWQSSPPARSSINPDGYEEREVCSPQPQPQSGLGVKHSQGRRSLQLQLRRQRVVRRKRKITTKISSSVRQSAQKLLAAASRSTQKKLPHATSTSSTCSSRSKQRHISPDSGHNSTSDCEFEAEQELDSFGVVTKRRLSFSFHEDAFVEK